MDQHRQTQTQIRAVAGQDAGSCRVSVALMSCMLHVMDACFADFVCLVLGGMGGVEMSGTRLLLLALCGPRGKSKSSDNGSISRTSILRRVCCRVCSSVLQCVAAGKRIVCNLAPPNTHTLLFSFRTCRIVCRCGYGWRERGGVRAKARAKANEREKEDVCVCVYLYDMCACVCV